MDPEHNNGTDGTDNGTTQTTAPGDGTVNDGGTPSNADFKNTPAYQSMAKQLAEYQKKESDRQAAEAQAKKDAERQRLESEGNYTAALAQRDAEIAELQAKHNAELIQRDIRNALYKAGFKNEIFINGAISAYKEGDISEYVVSITKDESNAMLLGQQNKPAVPPPGTPPVGGGATGAITDQASYLNALRSGDPNQIAAARKWGNEQINSRIK